MKIFSQVIFCTCVQFNFFYYTNSICRSKIVAFMTRCHDYSFPLHKFLIIWLLQFSSIISSQLHCYWEFCLLKCQFLRRINYILLDYLLERRVLIIFHFNILIKSIYWHSHKNCYWYESPCNTWKCFTSLDLKANWLSKQVEVHQIICNSVCDSACKIRFWLLFHFQVFQTITI